MGIATGTGRDKVVRRYYVCRKDVETGKGSCPHPARIRRELLEELVLKALMDELFTPSQVAGAAPGTIHVIINGLHPYFSSLEAADAIEECLKQYIYEAIAEYRVSQLAGRVNPDSARRYKDGLLRVNELRANNVASAVQDGKFETKLGS